MQDSTLTSHDAPRQPTNHASELWFRWRGVNRTLAAVGLGFIALAVIIIAASGVYRIYIDWTISLFGERTTGKVEQVVLDETAGTARQTPFRIDYTFEYGAQLHSGRAYTYASTTEAPFKSGDPVEVAFVASIPAWSRAVNSSHADLSGLMAAQILTIKPVIGLILLSVALVRHRRQQRIYRFGKKMAAPLHENNVVNLPQGGQDRRLTWIFKLNGQEYWRTMHVRDPELIDRFAHAREVDILVDPRWPRWSLLFI